MVMVMWLQDDTLKDVVPVGVLVLLLGLRVLGLCCCATSTRARPRRRVHLVIASLALGLGCAAAALLLEASPGSLVWPPPPRAIAAAAAWGAVWPIAALVGLYELRVEPSLWRRRIGVVWLLLACAARVVPLALGLLSSAGSQQLLPWLPVQAALLLAAVLLAALSCRAAPRRGGGSLLGSLVVEPLNTRTAPDGRAAAPEDDADAQAEAAAMELQRVQWTEEQKDHERIAPRGAGCMGFVSAFHKLHLSFLSEAKELQKATDLKKHGKKAAETDRDEGYTMSDSVRSLRRHLWALCPKTPLFVGACCSVLLTASSFGAPYAQGRVFDVAVDAFNRGHNGAPPEGETWQGIFDEKASTSLLPPPTPAAPAAAAPAPAAVAALTLTLTLTLILTLTNPHPNPHPNPHLHPEQIMPWLLLVSGLYVASWVFEILVGILFAVAAHTTLTRLRNRMFLNLVQQVTTLHAAHCPL